MTRLVSGITNNAKELGIWVVLGIGGDSGIHAKKLVELLKSVNARPMGDGGGRWFVALDLIAVW